MMETLERLMKFHGSTGKGIVWEHNTHIGDARATDMARAGMVNIGQLARVHYGEEDVYLAGFGSYQGSVVAGEEWGAPMRKMTVPPAKKGSIEALMHAGACGNCFILFREETNSIYFSGIAHRAIGVVYNPDREKNGNYVPSVLSRRYDAFIYLDRTNALHPLHVPTGDQVPETYPFGV
jgi:erythromycin esterase-like protein